MFQPLRRAATFVAACLTALPMAARGDTQVAQTPPNNNLIFDPLRAPEIVIHIGVRRIVLTPHQEGNSTTLSTATIENKANSSSFSSIIASSVAGAAASASGELHIRGSHGQYTYYLDGAPLPQSVSGSFTDLIDPKNIETLRVYTGGFPAKYGGNLAAVFDVTAKTGRVGRPGGSLQQIIQGDSTYETTAQIGGSSKDLSYFVSGVHHSTNRFLDPVTQDPIHDAGSDSVAFGKFDYNSGAHDRVTLDTAHTDGEFQIPTTPDRAALGQNDLQKENGTFSNLIWRHTQAARNLVVAFYSHESRLRYFPSAADLSGASADSPLNSASEDRTSNYLGLRTDFTAPLGHRHMLGAGFDVDTVTGTEQFQLSTSDDVNPVQTITDNHNVSGNDRAAYLQDDWTPGRFLINYGLRYDLHKVDTTTSQVSPRVNVTYTADGRNKFHAYYNRLFQPAPVEDIRRLDPNAAPFKPERDNFYEVGWRHDNGGISSGLDAYYKTEQDVIDENIIAGTRITEPFNVQKGYVRGLELSFDGALTKTWSFYANYARSWAKSAGDFTGGFVPIGTQPDYFYDDHDQTHTASMGLAYEKGGATLNLDGEYGSGFPYGQDPVTGQVNVYRVSPHFILNTALGKTFGTTQVQFTVDNLLNHPYVIKQASPLSDVEWGQARTLGIKLTHSF